MSRLLLLCSLLLSTASIPAQQYSAERPVGATAQQLPEYLKHAGISQHLGARLPLETLFTDERGSTEALRHWFKGRPVVIALVYYKCRMLCPEVLHGLAASLSQTALKAGDDYDVLIFSIDPTDTATDAALEKSRFLSALPHAVSAQAVHLLTGSPSGIQAISQATGFDFIRVPGPDGKLDQFAHSSVIMFTTPEARLSKYISGVSYLPRDVRLAILEASEKKISNPVDLFLTYCCDYNPAVGRYSFQVLRAVSIAGMGTLLLGGILMFLLMHGKQNLKPALTSSGDRPGTPYVDSRS